MAIGTTNYPTSLDTATELIRAVNDAKTTVSGSTTSGATTINVTSAAAAPSDGIAVIVSATDDTVREIVSYTGKTGTSLTGCTRNLESSGAKAWSAGDVVYFDTLTALSRTVLVDALLALETKAGIGDSAPDSGQVLAGTGAGASAWSDDLDLAGSISAATGELHGETSSLTLRSDSDTSSDGNTILFARAAADGTTEVPTLTSVGEIDWRTPKVGGGLQTIARFSIATLGEATVDGQPGEFYFDVFGDGGSSVAYMRLLGGVSEGSIPGELLVSSNGNSQFNAGGDIMFQAMGAVALLANGGDLRLYSGAGRVAVANAFYSMFARLDADALTTDRDFAFPDASGAFVVRASVPATASSPGDPGSIAWDGSHVYLCTATDTWVRAALATW